MGGKLFTKQTVRDVPLDHKTVLVRADYNVPLTKAGAISDDLRIRASIDTIQYLLKRGCKVVIVSHLGRPEGRDESLSLEPIAQRLATLLRHDVRFVDQTTGDKVYQAIKRAPKTSVTLLENIRFDAREEANDEAYAREIVAAVRPSYFVQDGFGVVHRAHTTTEAIAMLVPSVAGLLIEKEYTAILGAMETPKRPLVAVIGGAKVSDKIGIITKFIDKADMIYIGGAMANTFLAYKGIRMGASMLESDKTAVLDDIYAKAAAKTKSPDDFIVLPHDVAVAKEISPSARREVVALGDITKDDIALDIGNRSIDELVRIIKTAGTVVWNGTLGYAELPRFAHGSARLALALASQQDTVSIIGGGDTADFVLKWDGSGGKNFTHISTGGGASISLMSGEVLPGVAALLDAR